MGFSTSDDAAVYRVTDDVAMIQTVDFFTPVVDDPYIFGQIAAANALSDIYAMGGRPVTALNIVGFPDCLDPSVLSEIMAGGADKVKEADAVMAGGHSIQNDAPLYGLCVSGFVHPDRILRNQGAKPGDILILTKQLGSGIISTAVKADLASPSAEEEAVTVMRSLNRKAAEVLRRFPVHACTDITGFGLIGHALEMAEASQVTIEIRASQVPFIREADEYAEMGLIPAGAYRNRSFAGKRANVENVPQVLADLLFDPQTSGGLLFAADAGCREDIQSALAEAGLDTRAGVIGRVLPPGETGVIARE